MSANSERVRRIKERWETDRKISGADVTFLLDRAKAADTMQAADDLRSAARGRDPLMDLFFGR